MLRITKSMSWALAAVAVMVFAVGAEPVPEGIFRQMLQDDETVRDCHSRIGPAQLQKVLEARRVSLRREGGVDFIVSATRNPQGCVICGARRCCRWVYGQVKGQYRLLLTDCGADEIVPLETFTKGFRDLKVIYPRGYNYPAAYQIYSFDGREYKEKGKPKEMR